MAVGEGFRTQSGTYARAALREGRIYVMNGSHVSLVDERMRVSSSDPGVGSRWSLTPTISSSSSAETTNVKRKIRAAKVAGKRAMAAVKRGAASLLGGFKRFARRGD